MAAPPIASDPIASDPVAAPRRTVQAVPLPRHAEVARHPSAGKPVAARRPEPTASCITGGWTDRLVCRDPALAAQEARLGGALNAAAQAGVPMADLQDGQFAWLAARNAAARRSHAEVSAAYRQRIEEVESLAREAPPY